ncbi:benzoyl-CoA thioesterase [Aromatoleum aromaticum]|uniref:Thioesterase n=1 Tax=Aromatoleum aromaticum (strain DSM 19018 / LMG 30748 / EbN1) TaxID=76114 RepID=Q5P4U1_AROAE|nr:benzoyl-CoA thioesterase [Aromatoleum aromaticum]NMG54434.1 benzoyl-CoA thioesterase [Aromatoleum aromaticum]CAI07671.1 putative thioesterase [Aromatoleum aromaticum EbN1]
MEFVCKKSIRFHHCDPAGIVFYPQCLVLCNEVIEDWFDEGIGIDFYKLHAEIRRGVPMRHLEVDFIAPSMHGDDLTFTLVVNRIGNTSMDITTTASMGDEVRFRAKQTVVWADLGGAPRATPIEGEWRERFSRFLAPS